jgi:peptidoglycan/LPS O-acetylase OafA/YrhL
MVIFFRHYHNDAFHFALNLFLASSWGLESGMSFNTPAWSISVEVFLYGIFFAICRLLTIKSIILLLLSFAGFFIVSGFYLPFGRGIGSFLLGGSVFLLYQQIISSHYVEAFAKWLVYLMIVAWGSTWIASSPGVNMVSYFGGYQALAQKVIIVWPVMALFPLTILSLSLFEVCRGTFCKKFAWIGDISYSVYLLHFPLQILFYVVVTRYTQGDEVFYSHWFMLAFFAVLLPLSWASYYYFELPIQRYLRRSVNFRKTPEKQGVIGAYPKGS